jgi:hypothetical protein
MPDTELKQVRCTRNAPPAPENRRHVTEDDFRNAGALGEMRRGAAESRSLTNMFEVMVRKYAEKLGVEMETTPAAVKAGSKRK